MFNLSNKHILMKEATGYLDSQISYGLAELGTTIHVNSRPSETCTRQVDNIDILELFNHEDKRLISPSKCYEL